MTLLEAAQDLLDYYALKPKKCGCNIYCQCAINNLRKAVEDEQS